MLHSFLKLIEIMPGYESKGISAQDWAQMVGDMQAAAFKIWLWFH